MVSALLSAPLADPTSQNVSLTGPGPMFRGALNMNPAKQNKFPDFVPEFPDTVQMTVPAGSASLTA